MNSPKSQNLGEKAQQPENATSRPTFYMNNQLLNAIEQAAQQEHASRSSFVASLMSFLLLSSLGQQLQENARRSNRTLAQELEQSLNLFQEQLPLGDINQMATASQRSLPQMLTYLVLIGLQSYQGANSTSLLRSGSDSSETSTSP